MQSGLGALLGAAGNAGGGLTDPSEIAINRQGQVSAAQKRRLNPLMREGAGCLMAFSRLGGFGVLLVVPIFLLVFFKAPTWAILAAAAVAVLVVVIAAAVAMLGVVTRWTALNKDIAANLVTQAPGRLVYGRGRYEAEIEGRRLTLLGGQDLKVGVHYHFFYLPTSGLVVSAEARGEMPANQALASLGQSLAVANGFKPSALESNRAGRLGTEQSLALLPRAALGGFLVLVGLGVGLFVLRPDLLLGNNLPPLTRVNMVGFVGAGLPILFGLYYAITALGDILLGKVAMVEGEGKQVTDVSYRSSGSGSGSRRTVTYYYQIGERRFKVKRLALEALVEGTPYRAYYTAFSKTLVNVEAMASPTIL